MEKKSNFRNAIAPFCLLLGQLLLAINIRDALLLVPLGCACLALPLLQSQPHLWLAAPQSLLLQTENTKPFGLSPHQRKAKQPPAFPPEQPDLGVAMHGWAPAAGPVCTPCAPLSIFNKPWA